MCRSAWGVIVATLFTIATWATPVPEEWRWPLIFLAWFSLAISIIGWLLTHYQATGRIQLTRKVRTPMVTIIIFIACGSIGAIAWRLLPVSESKPKSGPQPASTTAAQQTPDSRAPAAVSATTKLVNPHPDRQTHKSTLRSPDLQIIYEDKLPY